MIDSRHTTPLFSQAIVARLLSTFLNRDIEDTVSSLEVQHLEKMNRWIASDPTLKGIWAINSLTHMAIGTTAPAKAKTLANIFLGHGEDLLNWPRVKAAVYFIERNIDQSPDYSLLNDWLNGEVNHDGLGRVRAEQEGIWQSKSIHDYLDSSSKS